MVIRVISHLADCPLEYAFHRQVRPVPANSINRWSANPQSTATLTETFGDANGRPPPLHDANRTAADMNNAVVFIRVILRGRTASCMTERSLRRLATPPVPCPDACAISSRSADPRHQRDVRRTGARPT